MSCAASETTSNVSLPPMLTVYLDYKSKYPDCLLLCQVGDFYEVFFEDAVTVAKTLNLTLTSRDKNSPQPIPMCGVPVGVVDGYLNRLVAAGYSVAVVSQKGSSESTKGMMPRFLERIVTPGVQVLGSESSATDPRVGALVANNGIFALAFTNVTSGVIAVREQLSRDELLADVSRAGLSEIVIPALIDNLKMDRRIGWIRSLVAIMGERGVKFRSQSGSANNEAGFATLNGMASLGALGKRAATLLRDYVDETTANRSAPFEKIQLFTWDQQLALDAATRRTLELVTNASDGSERHTLFSAINLTNSPGGSRLLRRWLLAPSKSCAEISVRQKRTEVFLADELMLTRARKELSIISDLERIATRIALKAACPRELAALRDSLIAAEKLTDDFKSVPEYEELANICRSGADVAKLLSESLVDEPAVAIGEGGYVIAIGLDDVLDRARALEKDGHGLLSALEARERAQSGVSGLKIKFNNQLGYFFEVTKTHAEKLPNYFQRRQSTTTGERFLTDELKQLEQELFSASGKARSRELELYSMLLQKLQPHVAKLRDIGRAISEIDVFTSFATIARERSWVKPRVDENSSELKIESGRHPVLEQILAEKFIPNDLLLDAAHSALIVTGPNMGGKSTYLRQAAQLTILAQIGSFVPARSMELGIVDGVFARLGASDNLAEGESTFMVEMREAALICAAATNRSLVVIDEIGRGTATADGCALAQAILEWLVVQVRCRALFATHFHELTGLSESYSQIGNVSVASVEQDGVVHFTHEIVKGAANRSYGIHVARHAGLPEPLLKRARELMAHSLEAESADPRRTVKASKAREVENRQLSIFTEVKNTDKTVPTGLSAPQNHLKIIEHIKSVNVTDTTPMKALTILDDLQRMLHE